MTGRADLTDAQWARLAPLMPRGKKTGRPPKWSKRQLIDGIRWRTRVGSPWRDVPESYGPWQTIYGLFRRWQRAGTWVFILKMLQAFADAAGRIGWQVSVDSTVVRAHQHAAGARREPDTQLEPVGDEPADHALGRSRGGWTTKLHLGCEQGCRPVALLLTAGQAAHSPQCYRCAQSRARTPTRTARACPGRQGLLLSRESRSPAPTRDQSHYPDPCRPGGAPPQPRLGRWPATGIRHHALPRSQHRRTRNQSPQAKPGRGNTIRQTRHPLPDHRPHRRNQPMATT